MCHTFLFVHLLFVHIHNSGYIYAKTTFIYLGQCSLYRVELTSLSKSCDQTWQQFEMTQADEIVSKSFEHGTWILGNQMPENEWTFVPCIVKRMFNK